MEIIMDKVISISAFVCILLVCSYAVVSSIQIRNSAIETNAEVLRLVEETKENINYDD